MYTFDPKKRYVLIGMGAFGLEIARTFQKQKANFFIILHLEEKFSHAQDSKFNLNGLQQMGFEQIYETDVTNPEALRRHLKTDDIVILSHGKSFEIKILAIDALKTIGVKQIYVRATRDTHSRIFSSMDVRRVVFPEKQEGKRFALQMMHPHIQIIDEIAPQILIMEVPCPNKFVGKNILESHLRSKYHINVICLKEYTEDGGLLISAKSSGFESTILKTTHRMVISGHSVDLKHVTDLLED
ncbi:potassium channel family protein [Algivirga pacifica]|uniref:TrkA family potassium uptake protein n=1 Tax=Algivirga pacifica TaxID=1162670 RepID=A0ABP9D1B7_9BACT